jgi:ribonuclease P protein component
MVEYNTANYRDIEMKQTQKQLLAQKVLAQHNVIRAGKITLLYTPQENITITAKTPTIIVSVPKKIVPKATARNYIKRVLRATLRQNMPGSLFTSNIWMWICKEPKITKEIRLQLSDLIRKVTP